MLKPDLREKPLATISQPPSGGCVLKLAIARDIKPLPVQPPSGGCVLKLLFLHLFFCFFHQPPSGGCVLKLSKLARCKLKKFQPPSGGCVLKRQQSNVFLDTSTSRLQAAVC